MRGPSPPPMPLLSSLESELRSCTHELSTLTARPSRVRNDFRNILHAALEAGLIARGDARSGPPLLVTFSMRFIFGVVGNATNLFDQLHLDTPGGWRRAVQVVKHTHYTLKAYGRTCKGCVAPMHALCEAITAGLCMDEEVAGDHGQALPLGANARNSFMLGLLCRVGDEMKALSDQDAHFYDFGCPAYKLAADAIVRLLRGCGVVSRRVSWVGKPEPAVVDPPPKQRPPEELKMIKWVRKPEPVYTPPQPTREPRPVDMKTLLTQLLRTMGSICKSADSPGVEECVSIGMGCFSAVLRQAVCSINGADLTVVEHLRIAVQCLETVRETAQDISDWSEPQNRNLSTMFRVVAVGLDLCSLHATLGPSGIFRAAFARTGWVLNSLQVKNPGFYSFLGKGDKPMLEIIQLLVHCTPHDVTSPPASR